MRHFHIMRTNSRGDRERGALCTTEEAAKAELAIENENPGRRAEIVTCDNGCFGTRAR